MSPGCLYKVLVLALQDTFCCIYFFYISILFYFSEILAVNLSHLWSSCSLLFLKPENVIFVGCENSVCVILPAAQ